MHSATTFHFPARYSARLLTLLAGLCAVASAQSVPPAPASPATDASDQEVVTLPTLRVEAEAQSDRIIHGPFLPEVRGTEIHAGKKTMVVDFDAMPQIQTDNYRQAFSKTPGLLTSELSNSSLLSLSFRGIGDPHESQNLMVLKDGIPFVLDVVGYPTVYFAPPFESLDRLEFTAGGGALLYGAQPSGALNYITHRPDRSRPWGVTTQHIVGSDNLYSTFSTIEGGNSRFGYLADFDHRSGDSFRSHNSDFELDGGTMKFEWDLDANQRLSFGGELYEADHGEPGGLSPASFAADPDQSFLRFDRVRLERQQVNLGHEYVGDTAYWHTRVWASEVVRYSKRQNFAAFGGGSAFFLDPTDVATGTNAINEHTYKTIAADSRIRVDHDLFGETSTFTTGVTIMDIDAPIWNETGATPNAERGVRTYQADRATRYAAIFAEHLFRFGRFTVTPAARVEFIHQKLDEQIRAAGVRNLTDDTAKPLFGLGSTYAATERTEVYANVSTAYKPKTYSDTFPTGSGVTSNDLEEANVTNYELGYRGRPTSWSSFDVSAFLIDYDNRFGQVASNIQNVGRSINQGLSAATEIDVYDLVNGPSDFNVSWHLAYQFLDAEFVSGDRDGRTPQYAPKHMLRTGLVVSQDQSWKIAALFTGLSDHWGDDGNTVNANQDFRIPAYTVLDLTAEARVWRGEVANREAELWLLAGVNNVLDESYFSRVRANGIDPANGRNYYVGLRAEF
jgi:Fe(3+) dicitrate transport protein